MISWASSPMHMSDEEYCDKLARLISSGISLCSIASPSGRSAAQSGARPRPHPGRSSVRLPCWPYPTRVRLSRPGGPRPPVPWPHSGPVISR